MSPEHAINLVKSVSFPQLDLSNSDYTREQQREISYLTSALLKSYRNTAITIFREEKKS